MAELPQIVSEKLKDFSLANNIFSDYKSSFRGKKQHSFSTAALKVVHDFIASNTAALFSDLSEAFVNHAIMRHRLLSIGLSEKNCLLARK